VTTQGCNSKPNKETFSRILKYHKPLNLYYNYKNDKTQNIFFIQECVNYKIAQTYLEENREPYLIEVL